MQRGPTTECCCLIAGEPGFASITTAGFTTQLSLLINGLL